MSKHSATLILGILVILVPFSGFPRSWKTFLLVAFGLIIIGISYIGRQSAKETSMEVSTNVHINNTVYPKHNEQA